MARGQVSIGIGTVSAPKWHGFGIGAHVTPFRSTYSGTWVNGNRQGWGTQKYMKVDRCKWERGTYTGEWEVFDNSSYYHGRVSLRTRLPCPRLRISPHVLLFLFSILVHSGTPRCDVPWLY